MYLGNTLDSYRKVVAVAIGHTHVAKGTVSENFGDSVLLLLLIGVWLLFVVHNGRNAVPQSHVSDARLKDRASREKPGHTNAKGWPINGNFRSFKSDKGVAVRKPPQPA